MLPLKQQFEMIPFSGIVDTFSVLVRVLAVFQTEIRD